MSVRRGWIAAGLVWLGSALVPGCGDGSRTGPPFERTEDRVPCADHQPLRQPLFGDLHVHTELSFDAYTYDVRVSPEAAYAFARGEAVALPPLGPDGEGTRTVRLDRPLDFVALTDHSEYLAEVRGCTTPSSPAYDNAFCVLYRSNGPLATSVFGGNLLPFAPERFPICGQGRNRIDCLAEAADVWARVQRAAEGAYDRSEACGLATFVGYEWTGTSGGSNLHRNVIFRNDAVPDRPISYFDEPTPEGLWAGLAEACLDAGTGCDVLAIPHNSNTANGRMFRIEQGGDVDEERAAAARRAALEPLIEIYQHKGDSECRNGLSGLAGAPDEACGFEKFRLAEVPDCAGRVGFLGLSGLGCLASGDFYRGALAEGLAQERRLGVNPLRLGVIASTDTHNGTPGEAAEARYVGHVGLTEGTPHARLEPLQLIPGGVVNSPGGLAGAWAEERSRDAIFEAFRRRETFGTSGPRIVPRFFAGWDLPGDLCERADLVDVGYERGVPMGGRLPAPSRAGGPTFAISALREPDGPLGPGMPLQRLQVIKVWLDGEGTPTQRVFDVAVDPGAESADVDLETCEPRGTGADSLCAVWSDPDFDPGEPAAYYARALENPTCRWSTRDCLSLDPADRPPTCSDPSIPLTIRERAWTSPVWYEPG